MFGTGLLGPFGSKLHRLAHRIEFSLRGTRDIEAFPRRLNLGCGPLRAPGFCNVDITPHPAVDVIDNVATLDRFPDNYADAVYACHVLEHFSHAEVPRVLRAWRRVLKPGGEIRISVPDLDRIVRIYMDNFEHFRTGTNSPWIGLFYGGQIDSYDFHRTGFNFHWLRLMLTDNGFERVEEYPHAPHFIDGFTDASVGRSFDQYISLNVRANKRA